ncbi:hypothetical protein [Bacillus sp. M6-12]|uniref:hypothetical protein n=1 Tax=Bacillus sp. M6-12 TaxID=2054166 RepID=UPI0026C52F9E|nr:hypothetical protein [Bacillus sp. M6-12]
MEKMYILLTNTGTNLSKIIKSYTKEPYNHASISFTSDLSELYSFGRKTPNNPLDGGFVKENIYFGTYRKYPETTCALYEIEVTKRQKEKMIRMIKLFQKNESFYFYNFIGLFGVVFNEPINRESSYFCSQFVATVFKEAGIYLWEKEPGLLTPTDLSRAKELNPLYEGKLYEYPPIRCNPIIHAPVNFEKSLTKDFIYPTKRTLCTIIYRNPDYSFKNEFLKSKKDYFLEKVKLNWRF